MACRLLDGGIEQADKRTWLSVSTPIDRQRRNWLEASRRAVQALAQVLHRSAARGQRAAPAVSFVRKPIGEESRTNRQSPAQCRRGGGQAMTLPEDIATRLLKAMHGGEHDIN